MTSAWVEYSPQFPTAESVAPAKRLDVFDWIFFAAIAAVTTAGPWLREAGALGFGLFSLYCLFYATLRRTLFELNWFVAFSATGAVYVLLSYLDILPEGWTVYYDTDAIPLQASFVWTFYATIGAGRAFFVRALPTQRVGLLFATLILLNLFVSPPLKMMIAPIHLQEEGLLKMAFSNLANGEMIMLLALAHLTMVSRQRIVLYICVAFVLLSVFVDFSVQIHLSLLAFLAFHVRALSRWAFIGGIIVFAIACIIGPLSVELSAIAEIDPNTAIRGYMWGDAIDLFFQSYGLGVGFGRELVRNIYLSMNIMNLYSETSVLLGGIHNSFISMFARLGLLGGLFFLLAVLKTAWPSAQPTPMREPAYFAFFMAYIGCWVNVAVESPMASIGTALLLGYVMAARDLSQERTADALPNGTPRHA